MIQIKNKRDAISKMKELKLNYFPCDIFLVSDLEGIKKFIEKHPAEEYVLRNPNKAKAKFFFVKNFEEAQKQLKNFKTEVTIDESYRPYKEDLVLVGDINIHKSGRVDLVARDDIEATQRNIYENPKYNLCASLEEDKLWDIRGFDKIARYISDHELYDVICEFSVYSIRLGVNKENVVISEIRTDF